MSIWIVSCFDTFPGPSWSSRAPQRALSSLVRLSTPPITVQLRNMFCRPFCMFVLCSRILERRGTMRRQFFPRVSGCLMLLSNDDPLVFLALKPCPKGKGGWSCGKTWLVDVRGEGFLIVERPEVGPSRCLVTTRCHDSSEIQQNSFPRCFFWCPFVQQVCLTNSLNLWSTHYSVQEPGGYCCGCQHFTHNI